VRSSSESRVGRIPNPLNRGAVVDPSNRQVPQVDDDGQLQLDDFLDELVDGKTPGVVTLLGKAPQIMSGRLSTVDVAVLAAMCSDTEIPEEHPDGSPIVVRTSIKRLAKAVYGYHGGQQTKYVRHALVRLLWTMFTVPGMDHAGRATENGGVMGVRCLGGVEWFGQDLHLAAAAAGQQSISEMARTVDRVDADAPLNIVLEPWLVGVLRRNQAARVDLALLQLMGRGLAARVWMFLEAERYETVIDPETDSKYGRTYIDLAPPAMATLGLDGQKHKPAARRDLRKALLRILSLDPGYRRAEVIRTGPAGAGGRYRVVVERWDDATRRRREHFPQAMSGKTRRATRRAADEQAAQIADARRHLRKKAS
jgi:hypothetical protein